MRRTPRIVDEFVAEGAGTRFFRPRVLARNDPEPAAARRLNLDDLKTP
jgi:hypothetical protein